jgi:hypothetical protein
MISATGNLATTQIVSLSRARSSLLSRRAIARDTLGWNREFRFPTTSPQES